MGDLMPTHSDISCQDSEAKPCLIQAPVHDYFKDVFAQNKRDEESRAEHSPPPLWLQMDLRQEACQRCGSYLKRAYILNGRRLCRRCVKEEQESWEIVSGESTSSKTKVRKNTGKPKSAPRHFMEWLLIHLGIGKKALTEPLFVWQGIRKPQAAKRYATSPHDLLRMPKSEGAMSTSKGIFHMKWAKAGIMKLHKIAKFCALP